MSVILAFNIQPEKLGKLRMLCARVKARLRPVSAEEYSLTLSDIIAGSAPAPDAAPVDESFDEEMLVMAGISGAQLNLFLQDFKRFGIAPIALKAMLTATNSGWTPVQLHSELSAEREAFARGMSAHEGK
ncbi:MAG: DUF3783 domain-containing protein [Candidatus Fimadaptatus sp.]|jgi:hypothetical protein